MLLGAMAAADQLVGILLRDPGQAFWVAIATLALGFALLIAWARLSWHWGRSVSVPLLPAVVALATAVLMGASASYAVIRALGPGQATTGGSLKAGLTPRASSTEPVIPSSVLALPSHIEITDNRLGTPVFRDPEGKAVDSGPEKIPFDTQVAVPCWTESLAGMASVKQLYLIETAPWTGEYASADTFANGDPVGAQGGTAIDPAVPHCPHA